MNRSECPHATFRPRSIGAAVVLAALFTAGCGSGGASARPAGAASKSQLEFGVEMANRGLWNEALFRFEQARSTRPGDAKVLNDLAVAYEAVGRFEEARTTYEEALKVAPGNRDIKKNYTRFVEFYQNFKPAKPAPAPAPAAATEGSGQ